MKLDYTDISLKNFFIIIPLFMVIFCISCMNDPVNLKKIDITKLVEQGKLDEAASQLTRYLAEYPNDADLLYNLAVIQKLQGNLDTAERTLKKVLSLSAKDDAANFLLIEIYIATGNVQIAWDNFHKLSESFRQKARPQYTLGVIHAMLGNWQNAEGCFRTAIQLQKDFNAAKAALAFVVCKQGRLDEGKAFLQEAENLVINTPDAYGQIAECHLMLGQAQKSRDIARSLVEKNASDASLWALIGRAEMILLNFGESESAFTRALTSPNATPWTQVQYAEMLFAAHREDEALAQAIDAETHISSLKLPIRNPSLYNLLATLYAKNGQILMAQQFLNRSYQIDPKQVKVRKLLEEITNAQNETAASNATKDTTSSP